MREKSTLSSDAEITLNYLDDDYRQIVRPNQLFLVPDYFITYWLRKLGPTLAWIVVSLQQAYWRSHGDHCIIAQTVIAEEIGIHRHTVAKELKENFWRGWHIPTIAYQKGIADENGIYHPLPNRYEIYDTPPLTPEHLAGLYTYFRQAVTVPTPAGVQQAINRLLNLKSRESLSLVEEQVDEGEQNFEKPHSVRAVVELATRLGFETLPVAEGQELRQYCSRLETHLTDIGKTLCRQYFRQEWVPLLGPPLAWLVMIFRSRAYCNFETGELRDTGTWAKKELETLLGQSYRNIRNLLAHPYAGHFLDILDQGGRKITVRVAMAEEPLTTESAANFWQRQPRPEDKGGQKWKNFDITLSRSGKISTSSSLESGNISTSPGNISRNISTLPRTKVEKTRHNVPPSGNISTHESTMKDSVLPDIVKGEEKELIQTLLTQVGLSGVGLRKLVERQPPLDLLRVKAIILYAEANGLTPGYIYRHLENDDQPVEPLFLQVAALDESTLDSFWTALEELEQGGNLRPAIQTSLPAEVIPLFVEFAVAFTGFERETVLAALSRSPAEAPASLPEPAAADEFEALWLQVLDEVRLQMPRSTFDSWVKDTYLVAQEGAVFTVLVPSSYAKEWLENRLTTTLSRTLSSRVAELQEPLLAQIELRFVVEEEWLK